MTLVCPSECLESENSKSCLDRIVSEGNPITAVRFLDLRQSMNNGGGPACLRLRVVLNEVEQQAMHDGIQFDERLYADLTRWVQRHYRDELRPDDLRDPQLIVEVQSAQSELATILKLPAELLSGE